MSASAANAPQSRQRHARTSAPRARLLVVEDEALISSLVADELKDLGFAVVGPACSVAEAVFLASRAVIDAALVDLSLGGVLANDVIDALARRDIPFVFVTGYSSVPEEIRATALLLEKPFTEEELLRAIDSILPGR